MATNDAYVYEHWRADTGRCFYVGKGRRQRAFVMGHRNRHHRAISRQTTVYVVIVQSGLSDEAALALEIQRIAFWRAAGHPLCNLTDGGEGAPGMRLSPEAREKIRAAHLGRKRSPEMCENIRRSMIGRTASPASREKMRDAHLGQKFSEERKAKISAGLRGHTISSETRQKIRMAQVGKILAPDHLAKLRTPEMRARCRAGALKRWAKIKEEA
jgi:hypothetical protein